MVKQDIREINVLNLRQRGFAIRAPAPQSLLTLRPINYQLQSPATHKPLYPSTHKLHH